MIASAPLPSAIIAGLRLVVRGERLDQLAVQFGVPADPGSSARIAASAAGNGPSGLSLKASLIGIVARAPGPARSGPPSTAIACDGDVAPVTAV